MAYLCATGARLMAYLCATGARLMVYIHILAVMFGVVDMACVTLRLEWPNWPGLNVSRVPPEIFGDYTKTNDSFCKDRPLWESVDHNWYIVYGYNDTTWVVRNNRWMVTDVKACGSSIGVIHGSTSSLLAPSVDDYWWYLGLHAYKTLIGLQITCLDPETTTTTTTTTTATATTTTTAITTHPTSTTSQIDKKKSGESEPEPEDTTQLLVILVSACTAGLAVLIIVAVVIVVCVVKRRSNARGVTQKQYAGRNDNKTTTNMQNSYVTGPEVKNVKHKHKEKTVVPTQREVIYDEITQDNGEYLTVTSQNKHQAPQNKPVITHTRSEHVHNEFDFTSKALQSKHGHQAACEKPHGYVNTNFQSDVTHKPPKRYLDEKPRDHKINNTAHNTGFDNPDYVFGYNPQMQPPTSPISTQTGSNPGRHMPMRQISESSANSGQYSSAPSEQSSTKTSVSYSSDTVLLPRPGGKNIKGKMYDDDAIYLSPVP